MEKDVAAGSRGWEEYQRKFPHLAFIQRYVSKEEWSERKGVKEWLAGGDESRLMEREEERARSAKMREEKEREWRKPVQKKVEK